MNNLSAKYVIALDVGGTTIRMGMVGTDQSISSTKPSMFSSNQDGSFESLIHFFINVIRSGMIINNNVTILGVGIGMPGPFDYKKGISKMEHKFKAFYKRNIKERLEQYFNLPVYFVNDAEAFGIGEWWLNLNHPRRLLVITLGTGLGACFIVDGVVQRSGRDIPKRGELWNVPWQGKILEDFISRRAIEQLYEKERKENNQLPFLGSVKEIAEAARQDNDGAQKTFENFGINLGKGLADSGIDRFKPDVIVLGGQISKAFDLFGDCAQKTLYSQSGADIPMIPSQFGDATAVMGAGYHCLKQLGFIVNSAMRS